MSLIDEALRKTQELSGKVQSPPKEAPAQPAAPAHSWPSKNAPTVKLGERSSHPALLLASVVAVALVVFGVVYWFGVVLPMRSAAHTADQQPTTHATASTPSFLPKAAAGPTYRLTGIIEGMGASVAVINGEIVGVGDAIAGATVVDVASRSAVLRTKSGQDLTLQIPD